MKEMLRNTNWSLVEEEYLDLNSLQWGPLYRYAIYIGVPAGTTVKDGWSNPHTAPAESGTYSLYEYVSNGSLQGFRWAKED